MLRLEDPDPGSREFGYVRAALEATDAAIGDEIAVARHLQVARVFAIERHRIHGSSFEGPTFSVRQFDDMVKPQFPQERQIIVREPTPISSARYDDRRVFVQMQERARIHMIVVIVSQKDRSRFSKQRPPERRDRRLRKPRE